MRRCVILGGAPIGNYDYLKTLLKEDDYLIYCDGGLRHEAGLGRIPDLVVGDFDSYDRPDRNLEIIQLPTVKDDTDTVYAMREGLKRGFEEFILLGVCGGRLDHTLGNVYGLLFLREHGAKRALIVDDYSEMELVMDKAVTVTEEYPFFSLLNITGEAEHVNIRNAKYLMEDGAIPSGYQFGISNEVLPGRIAEVTVGKGMLLLIRVRRDI